ncbi:hypothetical protein GA0115240_138563 [Streptomyces sp. DvalAA-14]|uniref:hypothetical protein n=1 Tax=unclassified Streptomyces TaxID=2593676 RepID=UPI00081AEF59|nr:MULTISPECIES: hypothetical protein [unclassified Streptomyces]MYS22186.1 hypothetical protein [Streptomyces sp. SID4948]SCE10392.1 hypothetical protein GA0115240_138563 [Streptomyces sp. DvalAA-14]
MLSSRCPTKRELLRLSGPLRAAGVPVGTAYGDALGFPVPAEPVPAPAERPGDAAAPGFRRTPLPLPPPHPATVPSAAAVQTATAARSSQPFGIPHP